MLAPCVRFQLDYEKSASGDFSRPSTMTTGTERGAGSKAMKKGMERPSIAREARKK